MRNSWAESLYSIRCSEPGLDAFRKCVEIADALDLVIGELNAEMIFEARQQFQRLQAVDPQLPVEIVARLKFGSRKFEMGGGKIQDFFGRLFVVFIIRSILQEDSVRRLFRRIFAGQSQLAASRTITPE
jgi:hypothetical protein